MGLGCDPVGRGHRFIVQPLAFGLAGLTSGSVSERRRSGTKAVATVMPPRMTRTHPPE